MGRAPCCDKANVKKGPWSPEEDAKLKSYIDTHGTGGNWIALPQKIGLKRCGKSCRLRWLNYLRPNIKHGGFSEEEDNIICSLYISIGSRWSIIAAQLPGRTDNDIKNYWNTRLKKKLLGKHRKERSKPKNPAVHYQPPPPPLPVLQPIPYSDDRASIRRLLMKLGGKFSTQDDHMNSSAVDYQPLIQPNPIDHQLMIHQTPLPNLGSGSGSGSLQGLDFFYDDFMINSYGGGESDHVDWGQNEMNPWVFAASGSSSDGGGFHLQESSASASASALEEDFSLDKIRYRVNH